MKLEAPRLQVREIVNSLRVPWSVGVTRCGPRNENSEFWEVWVNEVNFLQL